MKAYFHGGSCSRVGRLCQPYRHSHLSGFILSQNSVLALRIQIAGPIKNSALGLSPPYRAAWAVLLVMRMSYQFVCLVQDKRCLLPPRLATGGELPAARERERERHSAKTIPDMLTGTLCEYTYFHL